MKILILSNTPWSNDNSFGNTYSNLFNGMKDIEIANIFCRYGRPKNNVVSKYFQITEKSLLKNLFNSNYSSGKELKLIEEEFEQLSKVENKGFNHARKARLQLYFWIRDLIWKIGRWDSPELKDFLDDFQADIIFLPLYYSTYLNDIALFLKKYTNVPMVCYVSDDVYSLKQINFSLLYWIDRLIKRKKIKRVVNLCEHMYVISDVQKEVYEKCFNIECSILIKGGEFVANNLSSQRIGNPIQLVYTGNVGAGRWENLYNIGKELEIINKDEIRAELSIYTATPMTKKMEKKLNSLNSIKLKGSVPATSISQIQSNADVLVHVESFSLKERLQVRMSFSTKIVDYFINSRCIFAIGDKNNASINYLKKNDAALVACNKYEIRSELNKIINNPEIIEEYAQKSWLCGKNNHQIKEIQKKLYNNLIKICK